MESPTIITHDEQTFVHNVVEYKMESCHAHSNHEILFVVQNDIVVENNTDIIEVFAPSVVIHNNYTIHRATPIHGSLYDRYCINFNDSLLRKHSSLMPGIGFFKSANMTVVSLSEEMRDRLMFYIDRFTDLYEDAAACEYLTALFLCELNYYHSDENTISLKPKLSYINDVMNYITQHPNEDITLDSLANKYFISRAKLVADFKKATGMTVKNYITLVRMNTARNLLIEGHSVSETAYLCGYHSDSNFISTFKRMFGVSPGTFLRRLN